MKKLTKHFSIKIEIFEMVKLLKYYRDKMSYKTGKGEIIKAPQIGSDASKNNLRLNWKRTVHHSDEKSTRNYNWYNPIGVQNHCRESCGNEVKI